MTPEPVVLYPYPYGVAMRVTLAMLIEEHGTERWKALERVHQEWKHGKPVITEFSYSPRSKGNLFNP